MLLFMKTTCPVITVGGSKLSWIKKMKHLSVMDSDWQFDPCTLIRLDLMGQICRGQLIYTSLSGGLHHW